MKDSLIRILFDGCPVRAELVRIEGSWQQAIACQNLPKAAARLGGELSAAALMLASMIKFDGTTAIQAQGMGPVSLAMVEVAKDLRYRTVLRIKKGAEVPDSAGMQELLNTYDAGRCAVILDAADRAEGTQPYQGVVPLAGQSVASAIEEYMTQSEQLDTKLWLASDGQCAAGLMLQKMPAIGGDQPQNDDPEAWERICMLCSTVKQEELLGLEPTEVAMRLFAGEKARIIGASAPVFQCRCSEETVGRMLLSVGRNEVEAALRDQGGISVTCGFCGRTYHFSPDQARAIFTDKVN